MIRIYTRDAWLSYFNRYPCIVIDDDGLIYGGEEYRTKMIPHPIGKVDFSCGEIFGEDFRSFIKYPVGYIKQHNGITEIYGENYRTKLINYPVGYISGNQYYTYDEYHRFFRCPEKHIEKT